ncbi:MAG: lamin tail domain-containing protein [Planctomycetes bacterium]|nr:lamin tail domain-containing protein [Planctomycetota bacterium]
MKKVRYPVVFVLVAALAGATAAPAQGPIITELLADNGGSLLDEDGEASDWVEVHNPGASAVNLQGWHLTDEALNLTKWRFPSVEVAPGGYLVVFASSKNRAAAGSELHTNFKLDAQGEYLALVEPDGTTIATQFSPSFPSQRLDVSFGLGQRVRADKLIAAGAAARVLVPANGGASLAWTGSPANEPYPDASWAPAVTGIGYPGGAAGTPPPLPMAYWTFDRSSADATGRGQNAFVNGAVYSTDVPPAVGGGQSLSFDGLDDYVTAEVDVSETSYTASLWFKADAPGRGIYTIVDGDLGGNGHDRHLYLAGGNIASRVWNDETISSSGKSYGDRRWHHLAHVFGPRTGGQRIYVDGVLVASGAKSSSDFTWQQRVNIGFSNDAAAPYFDGLIDEAAIWDVELTLGEIQALAAGASPAALAGYAPWISTDVDALMRGVNATAYVRIPFQASLPLDFDSIVLRVQHDDGFAAYLNGVEVARRNAPAALAFDSRALSDRPAIQVIRAEDIGLGDHLGLLRHGRNVLAIHALNDSPTSPDFLLVPELLKVTLSPNRYLSPPTPGAPNVFGVIDFVADTKFSADRGLYDGPFTVSIATETPGAQIYYTLDGSAPAPGGATARMYAGALTVTRTTTLRAAAFKDDHQPTNVDTHTYIFLADVARQPANPPGLAATWAGGFPADYGVDPDVVNTTLPGYGFREAMLAIPTLSLTAAPDDLFGPTRGIYYNPGGRGRAWERAASLELIQPDGTRGFQVDAGIRMHGNSSRDHGFTPKHPFRVNFRREYGPAKLKFPFFDDSEVDSFDHLLLRGASTDSWPVVDGGSVLGVQRWAAVHATYFRDQYMRDSQIAMGRPSGHGTYVHLYVKGLYWGLYNVAERPVASFCAEHLGGKEEEYDVFKDFAELESGSVEAWNAMIGLANAGLATNAAYQRIQGNNADGTRNPAYPRYLDVDNLIDYMILHIASGAEDWPHHNWWGARRRGPQSDGFKFFVWDQEISNDSLVRTHTLFQTRFEDPIGSPSPSFLYGKCMANAGFRRQFIDRVQEHLFGDGVLTEARSYERWLARQTETDLAIVGESARWGDSKRGVPYKREVEWLAEMNWERDQYWKKIHPIAVGRFRRVGLYPSVEAPELQVDGRPRYGGHFAPGARLTMSLPAVERFIDVPLLGASATASAHVPSSDVLETAWRQLSYVEGSSGEAWKRGQNGVGYETASGYEGVIKIDVRAEMSGPAGNTSVFVRLPFAVPDQATIGSLSRLTLRILFDDGYAAFLNGTRVADANAPAEASLTWSSAATAGIEASLSSPTEVDLTSSIPLLRVGQNLLAIHGLNNSNGSSDMLIYAELVGGKLDTSGTPDNVFFTLDGTDPMGAGAPRYTGHITLEETVQVKARAFSGTEWSALTKAFFVSLEDLPLRVTEVMYHPEDPPEGSLYGPDDLDFLEVKNVGTATVDLAAVRIEGAVEFDFTGSGTPRLRPGEYALVVEDEAAFVAHYGFTGLNIAGQYAGKLSNGGERLFLRGPIGETLLELRYDDAWEPDTDGGGASLVIADESLPPEAWRLRSSWIPSALRGGSPGAPDGAAPDGGFQLPGDLNQDAVVDLSDAIALLLHLFGGAARPLPCTGGIQEGGNRTIADLDGDGFVTIGDPVHLLTFIFRNGPAPARGTRCVAVAGCLDACAP